MCEFGPADVDFRIPDTVTLGFPFPTFQRRIELLNGVLNSFSSATSSLASLSLAAHVSMTMFSVFDIIRPEKLEVPIAIHGTSVIFYLIMVTALSMSETVTNEVGVKFRSEGFIIHYKNSSPGSMCGDSSMLSRFDAN